MKKLFSIMAMAMLSLALVGCDTDEKGTVDLPAAITETGAAESPITMDNLDEYLGRDDVQYVDLREFSDKLSTGYIRGFEMIPFFGYLEGRMVTRDADDAWNVSKATVSDDFQFDNIFDEDKAIFLMCASGTRAGFIKGILDAEGYTTYNVGGFSHYSGDNKVLGDSTATNPLPAAVTDYTPAASPITMADLDKYLGRDDIQFVDLREFDDKLKAGYIHGFEMIPFFGFLDGRIDIAVEDGLIFDAEKINDDFAFSNYFDEDKAIFLMCASGGRAGYVKQILDEKGYTVYNLGGFPSYTGDHKSLGDGTYKPGE